jgi:hypothetical protein
MKTATQRRKARGGSQRKSKDVPLRFSEFSASLRLFGLTEHKNYERILF